MLDSVSTFIFIHSFFFIGLSVTSLIVKTGPLNLSKIKK